MVAFGISLVSAAVLAWVLGMLELIPWRRAAGAHWTERARHLFAARVAAILNGWQIPVLFTLCSLVFWPAASWIAVFVAARLGTIAGAYPFDRETIPDLSGRAWLHQVIASFVWTSVGWAVFAAALFLMPREGGWKVVVIGAVYLVIRVFLLRGHGLHLLRWLRLLHPAGPRLLKLVQDASERTGVAVRRTWELGSPQANALAIPGTGELVFTTKLLATTPDNELQTICAHELAHLAEPRWVFVGRVFGGLALFPLIFVRPVDASYRGAGFAVLGFITIAIWVGSRRFIHAMEKKADQSAVTAPAEGPVYARALERLHQTNMVPAVLRRSALKTHPDLYDRMLAANVTPDYPRPLPPNAHGWTSTVVTVLCTLFAIFLFAPK